MLSDVKRPMTRLLLVLLLAGSAVGCTSQDRPLGFTATDKAGREWACQYYTPFPRLSPSTNRAVCALAEPAR